MDHVADVEAELMVNDSQIYHVISIPGIDIQILFFMTLSGDQMITARQALSYNTRKSAGNVTLRSD